MKGAFFIRAHWYRLLCCKASVTPAQLEFLMFFNQKQWILQISSERTGTDFSAVKHQSHQPSSSIFSSEARGEFFRSLQPTSPVLLHRRNLCHSQSHPYGPGHCVGSKGSGWPGNWFECTAGWEEEPTSNRPGISSTECTGRDFSACKASADRPAKKNATSDVISSQPIACLHEVGHVFSPTSHEVYHVIHQTRRSEIHSLRSRLLWFQFFSSCNPSSVLVQTSLLQTSVDQ